ncbi:PucR family transcriptional regulator [Nocardia asteroides]|uniref:CdaR family transcriptional regulator n=1 Tax=Nocardia asteroides NBRC 15531 TaxID=1110697 RepID=U5E7L4_NOCAS|nr:helix-turn-helix domain-containing protein [Nocardia asteroides]UGT51252.1 helix-turn-helix domain-containing protein [Nocardia asteroides]GAD85972.1 putative CdaR family transcriptional regulator [Nocardia asteroides NBRC 15531]SFM31174.1 PucR C-terminal helix-turn-helix domain-containing protein [Nocardia asteroides]VEG35863.1 Sugar diacid utilization regulator [Nocardia asteroides]
MPLDNEPLVRAVASRIKADLDRRTTTMTAMFVDIIPEFRHDDEVLRLMVASTESNLVAILDMLTLAIGVDDITVPPAAAEYARRFAQHDLSLEGLLRAYRLGENMFVQWTMALLAELNPPTEVALATAARIADVVNGYIDRVIEGLIDIYEDERRRWDARTDAARAAQVRAVLDADDLDLASAEQMLSVSLRGWHQMAVLWTLPGTPDPGAELRAGTGLLADATGRTPMTIEVDDHSRWVWIASAGRAAPDTGRLAHALRAHPNLSVALGDPATGLEGFRQTFRDAQRARAIALATRARGLTDYAEVALSALFTDRVPDVQAWASRILGGLMGADETAARLRETVRAFLDARGSYTDAAARLHVHKNTVHYRVRKAEELLGHPLTDRRLDLEVALRVCAQLGLPRSRPGAPPNATGDS